MPDEFGNALGNSIVHEQQKRALVEQTFLLTKALGEGLTAQEMARLDASMEASNRELAGRIDASATARLAALNAQQMSETRASIDARAAATIDAAARTASMHAGVTARNAQRDAIMQARQVNALNATNAAIARGMAMAYDNGHASGIDVGQLVQYYPRVEFDFNDNVFSDLYDTADGARVAVRDALIDGVVGTVKGVNTLVGANLDLLLNPLGIDAFAQHTQDFRAGITAISGIFGDLPGTWDGIVHASSLGLERAMQAAAAGNYSEMGRELGGLAVNTVSAALGGYGLARTGVNQAARGLDALGAERLQFPLELSPATLSANGLGLIKGWRGFISPRYLPGVATYGDDLVAASRAWLDPAVPTAIPLQVAEGVSRFLCKRRLS